MSTIKTKKSDGSEINFHLKLENGLPLKTMISPNHKYMINELNQKKY